MLNRNQQILLFLSMAVGGAIIYFLTESDFWLSFGATLCLSSLAYLAIISSLPAPRKNI